MKGALGFGLIIFLGGVGKAVAQHPVYNRWEAGSSSAPKAPSGAARGTVILAEQLRRDSVQLQLRLRQDSLTYNRVTTPARLVRGLGQRLISGGSLGSEDVAYVQFLRRNLRYPDLALRSGMQGSVTVQLQVGVYGRVFSSRIINSGLTQLTSFEDVPITSSAKLQEAAREAMRQQARVLLRQLIFESGPIASMEELKITYVFQ